MARAPGEMNSIFRITPSGFHAYLHYNIFTCVAVPPSIVKHRANDIPTEKPFSFLTPTATIIYKKQYSITLFGRPQ